MQSLHSSDGTRIAYQRSGDGPPLVLVHGTADDHTIWDLVRPALSQHFTVYAIDRRGRGNSGPANSSTYSIERDIEDIVAVVKETGEPSILLGHSFGALCALEAALRLTDLRRLILYEPPFPLPPGSPLTQSGTLPRMDALLKAGDREGTVLTFAREVAHLSEDAIAAARQSPIWAATVDTAHTIADEIRAVERHTFDPNRFRNLTTSTLLLCGSDIPPFLAASTEAVAGALRNSTLTVLQGQGHMAMLTAPDRFTREVMRFLMDDLGASAVGRMGERHERN
jgi:pimeloyl-ACP methyl ester carboxylesterase